MPIDARIKKLRLTSADRVFDCHTNTSEPNKMPTGFGLPIEAQVPRLARRALNWSFALLPAKYVVSMASTAALARLLVPADYGLLAMVATITVMAQAVCDFGLSWATVQLEQLNRNQIDALFFINASFGLFLTGLCVLLAPYAASFYHHPELTRIIIAVSGTLFLSALAVQPTALLVRQMKVKELSLAALCALLISTGVTVLLAWLGFGYWALVAQLVLQQLITTLVVFPLSQYYPSVPAHLRNIGTLITFGGYSAAYGIVNYFARNLDNVLVGKVWGATPLGYYSRAYFLMNLPGMLIISVFSGVLIPAMVALRKEPVRMQSAYLRAVRLITVVGCSIAVGLAVTAPELVDFIYGRKWHDVVPILLWLSAASILQPIQNTSQWLYIVAGRGRGMLAMGLVVAGSATLAFLLGIRSGPIGVARAYAISNIVIAYPVLLMGHRACSLDVNKTIAETAPLLLCALVMGVVVWAVGVVTSAAGMGLHGRLATKISVGLVVYAFCLRQFARPTYSEVVAHLSF
jgi:O-antigen/teichoic acid export membrane protein